MVSTLKLGEAINCSLECVHYFYVIICMTSSPAPESSHVVHLSLRNYDATSHCCHFLEYSEAFISYSLLSLQRQSNIYYMNCAFQNEQHQSGYVSQYLIRVPSLRSTVTKHHNEYIFQVPTTVLF